jgi:molybdate transport system regulatory protein
VNRLRGTIIAVESAGHVRLVDVDVEGVTFSAILLGAEENLQPGKAVTLAFKETEVSLAKNLSGLISLRNRMPSTVRTIDKGRVLATIALDYRGNEVVSIITARSVDRLDLKTGDEVEALVKANEMAILHDEDAA